MTLETWEMLITGAAAALAVAAAFYSWNRLRALSWLVMVWFAAAWLLSERGFFADPARWSEGDLLPFMTFGTLMFAPVVLFIIAWRQSPRLRAFADSLPLPLLAGVEVYRVAGAVFLWMLAEGLVPPQLGLPTGIADIIIGVLALPLAWALWRGVRGARAAAVVWNLFGIADFATAITLVMLSVLGVLTLTPEPVRIGLHPLALISLFQLPFSLIVHGLALRKLASQPVLQPSASVTHASA